MKFQFKIQQYQTDAVNSVAGVFDGQPFQDRVRYARSPGTPPRERRPEAFERAAGEDFAAGYENAGLLLDEERLLLNIQNTQARNNIRRSERLIGHLGACSLDVEMETGTGKTYVYIKTIFELNRRYGWSRFIVIVPSIAIREGVYKTFQITRDHFMEHYGKKARFFIYNSKYLPELDNFGSGTGIQVMIINIQAFNARGADSRRIREELDDFGSRRPIDVIAACRPILILDEPQKMGGAATQDSLEDFNPLFSLNYSATHKDRHNPVYVLDAVDAFNQRLVKKIEVKGLELKPHPGAGRYLFLEDIIISPDKPPRAKIEFEIDCRKHVNRETRAVGAGGDLYALSRNMEQYRGCVVSGVDPVRGLVHFTNGETIARGEVTGGVSEKDMRRIQIRETILSHFEKERRLFALGVKTLSLFFIDEVAKYRVYDENGREKNGLYGILFEQEYRNVLNDCLARLPDGPYRRYLRRISPEETHGGYFSIDKNGRKTDGGVRRGSDESDDVSAYDLILKNKELLLSLDNPVRFIFSHSALREGWDNPNVFQICTLKRGGGSPARKRQEVGRGLRLCVDQRGERMDESRCGDMARSLNTLTVIAGEGYRDFVSGLQAGIREALYDRPPRADGVHSPSRSGFDPGVLEAMTENGSRTKISENPLNENFAKEQFQAMWRHISRKYAYTVDFDSGELIRRAIACINDKMSVTPLGYTVTSGVQSAVRRKDGFGKTKTRAETLTPAQSGRVKYDLIGEIAGGASLTRRTAAAILGGLMPPVFAMFRLDPEEFIRKAVGLIKEQKAAMTVGHISYHQTEQVYDSGIFTAEKGGGDLAEAYRAKKHIQDYVFTDGTAGRSVERRFAEELDRAGEVCVYAKLPKSFRIPTPVGDYSPGWAIAFNEGSVKHIYFIAETKGAAGGLSPIEQAKIACARRLFNSISTGKVRYHDVDSYQSLLEIMEKL